MKANERKGSLNEVYIKVCEYQVMFEINMIVGLNFVHLTVPFCKLASRSNNSSNLIKP